MQPLALPSLEIALISDTEHSPGQKITADINRTLADSARYNDRSGRITPLIAELQELAQDVPLASTESVSSEHLAGAVAESQNAKYILIDRHHEEISTLQASLDTLEREVFISAATTPDEYSAYMARWRKHVEAVGNHHAHEQVDLARMSGEVLLAVAVQADGNVRSIRVLDSSGHVALDTAAQRIARLASPYEAFPEMLQAQADVLHITRTWRFTPAGTRVTH